MMSVQALSANATLPRLLFGVPMKGAMRLREHLAVHGELPSGRSPSRSGAPALIDDVEAAGLTGRGGAAFPTATKMRAVADAAGRGRRLPVSSSRRRPVVVVNAVEGEPASLKDKKLLEALPHLVLDGASLAAQALGADEVIVAVCERALGAHGGVAHAIAERPPELDDHVRWRLETLPAAYVSGQESALVSFLNGHEAKPTFTPPMPFEHGVRRRPTLVSNAETFAHLALIARHGADWFRGLGTPLQPGSALLSISGPVVHPGVYEAEYGSSLASVIEAAGGLTAEVRAVLIGGYAGAWTDSRHLDALALSNEELAPYGASVGTGVMALLSADACGLAETTRVARWLASESAGQCGPCVFGLGALASTLEQVLSGTAQRGAGDRLAHLTAIVRRRGACSHPDGAARLVSSALDVFATELADHIRHGPCAACADPGLLPLPVDRAPVRAPAGSGLDAQRRPRRRAPEPLGAQLVAARSAATGA
jgi:NADH:ubiquinone oxidoreductase subunit F (NADH-binding)